MDKKTEQEFFVVTRVSRADFEVEGFDVSGVTDQKMERMAEKLGDVYVENLFWQSLSDIAELNNIPELK